MSLRGADVVEAGGSVIELVREGGRGGPPTEEEIRAWVTAHDLSVTTLGTTDARGQAVFRSREMAYIIDTETMTVQWADEGLYATPTIVVTAIDAMLADFL